jgi:hypothetical protein
VLTEEADALWDVTGSDDRVRTLFLEQGLRPDNERKFVGCAGLAVHAAVGLDPVRRRSAERLLLGRVRDAAAGEGGRRAAAEVITLYGEFGPPAHREAAALLLSAFTHETDPERQGTAVVALLPAAEWLEPPEAASALGVQLQRLSNLPRPLQELRLQGPGAYGPDLLERLALRLDAAAAAAALPPALERFQRETHWDSPVSHVIRALVYRLDTAAAGRLAPDLILTRLRHPLGWSPLYGAEESWLAGQVDEPTATRLTHLLMTVWDLDRYSELWSNGSARMLPQWWPAGPGGAARPATAAPRRPRPVRLELLRFLGGVAGRLDPPTASRGDARLLEEL